MSSDASDFDPAGLAELRRMYEDAGAREIVEAMLTELPLQLQQLQQAITALDRITLKRIVHTIKSMSLMLGAESLGTFCKNIETDLAAGQVQLAIDAAAIMAVRYSELVRRSVEAVSTD